jgi:hypothetical protein
MEIGLGVLQRSAQATKKGVLEPDVFILDSKRRLFAEKKVLERDVFTLDFKDMCLF